MSVSLNAQQGGFTQDGTSLDCVAQRVLSEARLVEFLKSSSVLSYGMGEGLRVEFEPHNPVVVSTHDPAGA